MPTCRICHSESVEILGTVEYYSGFPWDIHQCHDCGCRFTRYDPGIYDQMYRQDQSIYGIYNELAEECRQHFSRKDLDRLRETLRRSAKYRFVIDQAKELPTSAKVLELGCSRGHLTSYFILAGYNAIGVDISREAVHAASENFGPHFARIGSPAVQQNAPYDLIYHVGTIGCVGDPAGFTRDLLALLKPGGRIVFNAPILESCAQRGQLWIDAAPPPDLVTLFPSGFFSRTFCSIASVTEHIEYHLPDENCRLMLHRTFLKWNPPQPRALATSIDDYKIGRAPSRTFVERAIMKIARSTRLSLVLPKHPTPFGYFVQMTKPS